MAKRQPPKHSQFKPGQSGNPGGKAKVPDDIAKAKRLNQHELDRILNQYLWMDRDEMKARLSDPKTPMMEMMVGSIVAQAAQKGDQQRLEFILQRVVGKVKDQLVVTSKPFILERRDGTEVVMGQKQIESGESE